MTLSTILYLVIALIVSILFAYFQYYHKVKSSSKTKITLFILKTLGFFLLILLLINPKIKKTIFENIKPVLSILVDNSKSIAFFREENSIKNSLDKLRNNDELNKKFELKAFSFGNSLQVLDSLTFLENQTNISDAILNINELQKNKIAPLLILTDGNQTLGTDYQYLKSQQTIYPIVLGDTTKYTDISISQLNVNKYSFFQNKFPVEAIVNYEGKENISAIYQIRKGGKTVFRKNINLSPEKKSVIVTANLTSKKEGLQYYSASVSKLENEKNLKNNYKNFSVEVINEQTKVLIITSVLHPDIGTLKKAIESNKQRSVEVVTISNFNNQINDFQLIIMYQPNLKFKSIFNEIAKSKNNYFVISGTNTDWNFLNRQQLGIRKNAITQSENYVANFNDNFLTFLQEDIGFSNLPPLKDKFGEVSISKEHQTLLYQNINGVQTNQPLFVTFDENGQKVAFLFGEGVWKWRSTSFLNTNSFKDFDKFLGNITLYIASNKKRNRLKVEANNLYPSNSTLNISAFYTDKNYKFDDRASLVINLSNKVTGKIYKYPFSLFNNSFQVSIENLPPGDYTYYVEVLETKIKKFGRFKITEFEIEEQFTNANTEKLNRLAINSKSKLYFKNEVDVLIEDLLKNEAYYTTQKSKIKEQNLIDWKWVMFLIILLFTTEWLIRKYNGKI